MSYSDQEEHPSHKQKNGYFRRSIPDIAQGIPLMEEEIQVGMDVM